MKLGTNYKIESDALNVTVYQRQIKKKDGSEYWKAIGYFSRFQNAIKFIADLEINEAGMKDFGEVVKKQGEIYQLIEGMVDYER